MPAAVERPRTEVDEAALAAVGRAAGRVLTGHLDGRGLRVGLAASRFNGAVTARLLEGALEALRACRVDRDDVVLAWAPGAFELPLVARQLASANVVDAVVALGAVIRGETGHYDFVAGQCAAGLQRVQLDTAIPVAFGVLTTDTVEQAWARSVVGGPLEENKGAEAARTAVEMATLVSQVPFGSPRRPGP